MNHGERDAEILEHVRRYHLTTAEVLHHLFFPNVTRNAVTKVTTRLVREGRLQRAGYPGPNLERRTYFVLTPRQAAKLGEDRCIGKPFQHQGLVNALGVLLFCTKHGFPSFTRREFDEKFPDLVIPGVRAGNFYLDEDRTGEQPVGRLGFILVDYGSSLRAIERKVTKIITRCYSLPGFTRVVEEDRFVLAVVAPTATKAEAIAARIRDLRIHRVRFRVEVVPDLAPLLMRMGMRGREQSVPSANRIDDHDPLPPSRG